MQHLLRRGFAVLLPLGGLLLTGCAAEKPYYLYDYRYQRQGDVEICFSPSNTTRAELDRMAEESCNKIERTAKFRYMQKSQCSVITPDLALYACVARPGETPPPIIRKRAPLRHDTLPNTEMQ